MLELTLKGLLEDRIDGSSLTPQQLTSMTLADLMSLPLRTSTSRTLRLDELFWVQWPSGPSDMMVVRGDCSRIDDLGCRMNRGTLVIEGDAGNRVGTFLGGGTLVVAGSVGEEVCMGMRGGTVAIAGNCGDRLGAPPPGERSGIRGGDILIAGNVGTRACHRMRRGTVWIAGDVGDFLAPEMIAGTILVHGRTSPHWGMRMRRGTLVFTSLPEGESGASLSPCRSLELSFLPLVWNHLRGIQRRIEAMCAPLNQGIWPSLTLPNTRWVERRIADLAVGGKGEILILQRLTSTPLPPARPSVEGNSSEP